MQQTRVRSLGQERSPEEGNGNPLQYSCLENSMNRGAWQVTVQRVARIRHNLATKPPACGHLGPGPPQLKSAAPRASQTCHRPQSSTRLARAPHHCRTCGASKECPSELPPPPNMPCQSPAEANSKLNIWIEWEGESSPSKGCFTQAFRRRPQACWGLWHWKATRLLCSQPAEGDLPVPELPSLPPSSHFNLWTVLWGSRVGGLSICVCRTWAPHPKRENGLLPCVYQRQVETPTQVFHGQFHPLP